MEGKSIAFIFGILFLISFASAEVTDVQIKTLPYHEVQITAFDPGATSFTILDKTIGKSNSYGDFYWNFSTDNEDFNLVVFVKTLGHEDVIDKKYNEEYPVGEDLYIELAPSNFEFIESPVLDTSDDSEKELNETDFNETVEEVPEERGSVLTGAAIGDVFSNKTTYYVLGGIISLIVVLVLLFWVARRNKSKRGIKVKKLSELKAEQAQGAKDNEEIRAAEAELRAAQEKINALRNKDRISELQKDIEEKERMLKELGGNVPSAPKKKPMETPMIKQEQIQEQPEVKDEM